MEEMSELHQCCVRYNRTGVVWIGGGIDWYSEVGAKMRFLLKRTECYLAFTATWLDMVLTADSEWESIR